MALPEYALTGSFSEKSLPLAGLTQYRCVTVGTAIDPNTQRTIHWPYWMVEIPTAPKEREILAVRRGIVAVGQGGDGAGNAVPHDQLVLLTKSGRDVIAVVYGAPGLVMTVAGGKDSWVRAGDVIARLPANSVLQIRAAQGLPAGDWDYVVNSAQSAEFTLYPPDILWTRDPEYVLGD